MSLLMPAALISSVLLLIVLLLNWVVDRIARDLSITAETLAKNGVPVRTIHIPRLDEESMGELLMHFMLETMIAARLLGVDAFDQCLDERARLFHLLGRRRVETSELVEELRVLLHGGLQLGDPLACDLVKGGRFFVGGAPHVVLRLRRRGAQRVLELDEPRSQRLFEGGGPFGGGLAHGVV